MDVQGASPEYYALLVGIDAYPKTHSPLKSCAQDVRGLRKCLEKIVSSTLHTTLLVAAREGDPPDPSGQQEMRPSYLNVMSSLEQITDRAKPGDIVYVHYSGHGTKLPPGRRNIFSNHNTGDLAWVVLRESEPGIRYLYGSHLARKIKSMVAKGLRVTLVLDCCFSGSVMRDETHEPVARFLKYDPDIDALFPPEANAENTNATSVGDGAFRDASMLPSWMIDPKGFSIITACGPHEIAKHFRTEAGILYGRLSYLLIETFQGPNLGEFRGQFEVIYESLRAKFLQRFPRQNPMWYGHRQHDFSRSVSTPGIASQNSGLMYPVTQKSNGCFQLEGGKAHGICEGDEFDIHGLEYPAVATRVKELTSELNIVSPSSLDLDKGRGWCAKPRTTFSLRQYPVLLKLGLLVSDGARREEIRLKRPWLNITFEENTLDDPPYYFRVNCLSTSGTSHYEILDASNRIFKNVNSGLLDLDETLDVVEHLAKFYLFRDLL